MKHTTNWYKLPLFIIQLLMIVYGQNIKAQNNPSGQTSIKKTFRIPISFPSVSMPSFISNPTASPDGRHIMYVLDKKKKQCVGIDGVEQREFDEIRHLTFSPDSKRTAYIAIEDKQTFLVVDGKIEKTIEGVFPTPFWTSMSREEILNFFTGMVRFTPDSKKVYYRDKKGWHIDDKVYNIVDIFNYSNLAPVFSPDGSRFAFRNGPFEKNFVFIDGVEYPVNGVVMGSQLFFSPDSKHVAYMIIRPEGVFLNMDGKESSVIGNIQSDAYPQKKSRKSGAILYDVRNMNPSLITFSPDSKRFAYWGYVDKGKGIVVVEDGKVSPVYQYISQPTYSQDSKHFTYVSRKDNKLWIVLDGNNHIPLKNLAFAPLFTLDANATSQDVKIAISGDYKRIAYTGYINSYVNKKLISQKYVVGIDSTLDPNLYEFITTPEFSPDGSHIVYGTIEKIGTYISPGRIKNVQLFIDGSPREVDGVFISTWNDKTFFFDSNKKLHYSVWKKIGNHELEITMIEETIDNDK